MASYSPAEIQEILSLHKEWLNTCVKGRQADFSNAYLQYANLQGANLQYANLQYAYLQGAYLQYANLQYANLQGAYLQGAYLQYANLQGANLRGVKMEKATLPFGESWETYLQKVVPELLAAGGKDVAQVVKEGWECHSWDNCPMACAFGVKSEAETPLLLRPRVKEFVQFFDAGLIPRPQV